MEEGNVYFPTVLDLFAIVNQSIANTYVLLLNKTDTYNIKTEINR